MLLPMCDASVLPLRLRSGVIVLKKGQSASQESRPATNDHYQSIARKHSLKWKRIFRGLTYLQKFIGRGRYFSEVISRIMRNFVSQIVSTTKLQTRIEVYSLVFAIFIGEQLSAWLRRGKCKLKTSCFEIMSNFQTLLQLHGENGGDFTSLEWSENSLLCSCQQQ